MRNKRRFPKSLFSVGTEPDVRFSLANERTFLAWIRTSLALIVSGVAVSVFGNNSGLLSTDWIGLVLVVLGGVSSLTAYSNWFRTERALRQRQPLPGQSLGATVSLAIGLLIIAGLVVEFFNG
jgi:putative membrane protein